MTSIEALEEILEFLKITKEYVLDKNKTTELTSLEEILTVPIPVVHNGIAQAVMLKSIVPNPEWFDGNQMKFED